MEFTHYLAQFLRDNGFDGATAGTMPPTPDRVATVYATGLLPKRSDDGSRFQIIVRGTPGKDDALTDAMNLLGLLDEYEGMLTFDCPFIVQRIVAESGASDIGEDGNGRNRYSLNFRVWYC